MGRGEGENREIRRKWGEKRERIRRGEGENGERGGRE